MILLLSKLSWCLKQHIVCPETGAPSSPKEVITENALGCFHILPSSSYVRFGYFSMELKLRIKVEKHHIVNATFVRYKHMYSGTFCNMYHMYFSHLYTPKGDRFHDLCSSHAFPGDGISLLSSTSNLMIQMQGFFTTLDLLTVIFESIPKPRKLGVYIYHGDEISHISEVEYLGSSNTWLTALYRIRQRPHKLINVYYNLSMASIVHVFDGPGAKSPKLKPHGKNAVIHIRSSTPSVTILFAPWPKDILVRLADSLHFAASDVFLDGIMPASSMHAQWCHPRSGVLTYPHTSVSLSANRTTDAPTVHCLWHVHFRTHVTLQLDISEWRYSGPTNDDCSFGGMTLLGYLSRSVYAMLCGKMPDEETGMRHPAIWSSSNRVLLSVIFHQEYSSGGLKARVTASLCKAYARACWFAPLRQFRVRAFKGMHNYPCIVVQESNLHLKQVQEKGYGSIRFTDIAFDVNVETLIPKAVPCKFVSDRWTIPKDCPIFLEVFLNGQSIHLNFSSGNKGIYNQSKDIFEAKSILLTMIHWYINHQMFVSFHITNFQSLSHYLFPAGGFNAHQLKWKPTLGPLPYHFQQFFVWSVNTTKITTKLQIHLHNLTKLGYTLSQYSLFVRYLNTCPVHCTNDTVIAEIIKSEDRENKQKGGGRVIYRETFHNLKKPTVLPMAVQSAPFPNLGISISVTRAQTNSSECINYSPQCRLAFHVQCQNVTLLPKCTSFPPMMPHSDGKLYSHPHLPKCYFISVAKQPSFLSWHDAQEKCKGFAGHLAQMDATTSFSPDQTLELLKMSFWFDAQAKFHLKYLPFLPAFVGLKSTVSSDNLYTGQLHLVISQLSVLISIQACYGTFSRIEIKGKFK